MPARIGRFYTSDLDTYFKGLGLETPDIVTVSMARINQKLGHNAGFISTVLYRNPEAFNNITSGGNTDYNAGPGWDPCTDLGSPKGAAIRL